MKVLLVDDVALNHRLLKAAIRDLCDEGILIAERATEAIELALAEKPDLIFMDLALPDFDGLDAVSVIRNHPATAHIPIVIVSAHALPDVVTRAQSRGSDGYITKPVSINLVRNAVLRHLKSGRNSSGSDTVSRSSLQQQSCLPI